VTKGDALIATCCAVYVGVVIIPTGAYEGVWKIANGEHAADWAQFIGGMAAVAVAIWAAWHATHQTRLAAKAEEIRRIELVCSLGFQMVDLVDASWNSVRAHDPLAAENFDFVLRLYEAFPIDGYPNGELALRLAGIHRLSTRYFSDYRDLVKDLSARRYIAALSPEQAERLLVPKAVHDLVVQIGEEYDQLVVAGQRALDALPGRRHAIGGQSSDYSRVRQ
jgi:pimeloyl-ACP methyl ester carboxylesterase